MAKDSKRKCPDCNGSEVFILGTKGDGVCKNCEGSGRVYGPGDMITALINDFSKREKLEYGEVCPECSETGQCQTCGGEGYEYYNDESDDEDKPDYNNNNDDDYNSSYDTNDYDDNPSYSSTTSRTYTPPSLFPESPYYNANSNRESSRSDKNTFFGFFLVLLLIPLLVYLVTKFQSNQRRNNSTPNVIYYNNGNSVKQYIPAETYENKPNQIPLDMEMRQSPLRRKQNVNSEQRSERPQSPLRKKKT